MNDKYEHLMFERLTPTEIEKALAESPVMYIPIGTYEWHGRHLPVGNDALKAYGLCLRAAERTGGLVMPPFYYGTGGGHTAYAFTVIVEEEPIVRLLKETLRRMTEWGVKKAIILTGHFPGEQMDMVRKIAREWDDPRMTVIGTTDYDMTEPQFFPDHAAIFETSMLYAMEPELVKIHNLPDINTTPAKDPDGKCWGAHRNDPSHPLHGIFGDDPRMYTQEESDILLQKAVDWLVGLVEES